MSAPGAYLGERARFAAERLNFERPGVEPITLESEGLWRVWPVRTVWDSPMGGRAPMLWSDETIIGQAELISGGEGGLSAWIETRRSALLRASA